MKIKNKQNEQIKKIFHILKHFSKYESELEFDSNTSIIRPLELKFKKIFSSLRVFPDRLNDINKENGKRKVIYKLDFEKLINYILTNKNFVFRYHYVDYNLIYLFDGSNVLIEILLTDDDIKINFFEFTKFVKDLINFVLEESYINTSELNGKENKAFINVLIQKMSGFKEMKIDITESCYLKKDHDLKLNYGNDFYERHLEFMNLVKNKESGLILLHGKSGSGKTTYIKYLSSVIDKEMLLLSPEIVNNFNSPMFTEYLIENLNKYVFVCEDSEVLLKPRETGNTNSIDILLNLSDGIMGDLVKPLIICTFNINKLNGIDKALLRSGRLIFEHEFNELSVEDTNNLFKELGVDYISKEPMVLSDIYNINRKKSNINFIENKKIGFK